MPKPLGRSSSHPTSKAATRGKQGQIPSESREPPANRREKELNSYLTGDILDVSKASEYYQREAAAANVLTEFIETLPQSRYRLKNGFDSFFRGNHKWFSFHLENPADALAYSLCRLAPLWMNRRYIDALPGDHENTLASRLDPEWINSWKAITQKEWDDFEHMSRPIASYIITALDERSAFNDDLTYLESVRHVALGNFICAEFTTASRNAAPN